MTINWKKPTAQMLGRFQPFHDGHKTLFKEILKKNRAGYHHDKRYQWKG